jgi:hypothetical protein
VKVDMRVKDELLRRGWIDWLCSDGQAERCDGKKRSRVLALEAVVDRLVGLVTTLVSGG